MVFECRHIYVIPPFHITKYVYIECVYIRGTHRENPDKQSQSKQNTDSHMYSGKYGAWKESDIIFEKNIEVVFIA